MGSEAKSYSPQLIRRQEQGRVSRKRLMNTAKNILADSWVESPDAPGAMSIENKISCGQIHTTLSLGLFVACAANMVLFCAFL